MKKRFLSLILTLVICVGLSLLTGCDKGKGGIVIEDEYASSTTNSSVSTSSPVDTDVISKVQKIFNDVKIDNNVMESSQDTLYVGLPMSVGITDVQISAFAKATTDEKVLIREKIGWNDLITQMKTANDSVNKIISGSKYKHVLLHMYSATDISQTYLLFQDGVLKKDIFKID